MNIPALIDVAGLDRAYDLIIAELIRWLLIVDPNIKSFLGVMIRYLTLPFSSQYHYISHIWRGEGRFLFTLNINSSYTYTQ